MMSSSILDTILLSLKVSLCATVVVMVLSVIMALWLVYGGSKTAKMVEIMVYVPMAMPPVALGYGLLYFLGKNSFMGRLFHDYLNIDLSFSVVGAVIAAVMVSLGLGVRTFLLALLDIDRRQIDMAYLLGASSLQTLFFIILPQCRRALLGGSVLVFIRALSEFGATIVFAGSSFGGGRTLAMAIWVGMEVPGQERLCIFLVLIAIAISVCALVAVEIVMPKNTEKFMEKL